MKQVAFNLVLYMLVGPSRPNPESNPSTFWNDYPACERQCHQDVYSNQSCTLQNDCGCSGGCLCLDDDCLCATPSWLIAVSQCIGEECGPAAVTEAASIASSGCGSYGLTLAVNQQSLIQEGLAVVPSTSGTVSTSSLSSSTDSSKPTATRKGVPTSAAVNPSVTKPTSLTKSASSSSSSSSRTPSSAAVDSSVTNPTSTTKSVSSSSTSARTPALSGISSSTKGEIAGGVIVGVVIAALALLIFYLWGYLPFTKKWTKRKVRKAEAIEARERARADEAAARALQERLKNERKESMSHLDTNWENQSRADPGAGTDTHNVGGRAPASSKEKVQSKVGSSVGESDLPSGRGPRSWD